MVSDLKALRTFVLTPELVKAYSSTGNSIHYDMASANSAGFRALISADYSWRNRCTLSDSHPLTDAFDMSIYFRQPISWVDTFTVAAFPWKSIGLIQEGKVLTEARVNLLR